MDHSTRLPVEKSFARALRYAIPSITMLLLLVSCSGGGASTSGPGSTGGGANTPIAVWGDSTTSGVGASVADMSYPRQLEVLTGRDTYNGGVSGQTSGQIAARQGGVPALLTFPGNALPAAGTVVLADQSVFPVSAEGPGPVTGTVSGFHGTLTFLIDSNNTPHLAFTRDLAGAVETIPSQSPFYPDTFGRENQINVFWMGQNNFYAPLTVKSDIARCTALISGRQYIVMSLLNAGDEVLGTDPYNQLALINADLAQAYPDNFIDIRMILVENYDPNNAQDVLDHLNDVPPSSLRNDNNHLNDRGYGIVARRIASFITSKQW